MAEFYAKNSKFFTTIVGIAIILIFTACGNTESHIDDEATRAKADSLSEVNEEYFAQGKFSESITAAEEALRLYETLKDTVGITDMYASMANAYQRIGNIPAGMEAQMKALHYDSIANDMSYLSTDYNTLAILYLTEGSTAQAETFILKSIECEQKTETKNHLSIRYGTASEVYTRLGKYDLAQDYASKAYDIAIARKDSAQAGIRLVQLADTYCGSGNLKAAEPLYKQYLALPKHLQAPVSVAITYKQLGLLSEKQNKQELAIHYYEQAVERARAVDYQLVLCSSLQALGNLYARAGQSARAVPLINESRAIADTLHSSKVEGIMTSYAARYDKQEKERIIERQEQELIIHRFLTAIFAILIVLAIVFVAAIIIIKRFRQRHEQLETRLSEKVVEQTQHLTPVITSPDKDFLDKLAQYVEDHLDDSQLSSSTIAEEFCLSQRQFSRKVKLLTGIDTTHYIRASRIIRARYLLSKTDHSIAEIYVKCGFESQNYFTRIFRQDVGQTPNEYRRMSVENA